MMQSIADLDVTLKELTNLSSIKCLKSLFHFLNEHWYFINGKLDEDRANRIRIGTIRIGFDDNDHLTLEFKTRFSLTGYQKQIKKILEDSFRR
jgi:hypothetical protein